MSFLLEHLFFLVCDMHMFFLSVCQFFTYCHYCISFTYDNVLSIWQIFLIHFFNKLGFWTWKINYSSRLHGIHGQNFQQQFAIHYHIHDQNIFCSTVLCNAWMPVMKPKLRSNSLLFIEFEDDFVRCHFALRARKSFTIFIKIVEN